MYRFAGFNVSENDARKAFGDPSNPIIYAGLEIGGYVLDNCDVYNNTVFMSPTADGHLPPAARDDGVGNGSGLHFRNNIFITTGGCPVAEGGTGNDVLFQGNDYWSSGARFQIVWDGVTYTSLKAWRAATGQEMLGGRAVGYRVDPLLNNPGGGGTIGNPDLLYTLSAYQLQSTSSLRQHGLDLSQFGIVWDPYGFASDPFLGQFFSATPEDFYGDPLPAPGSKLFSIGADQFT